ncbi:SCAN domain-containing protein 3 [Thelohanellus kitauei]|uniref:SCAN domain-containing protein 3 n=1 Tax=Thelohanellus kitauei TaxID=669202 RepID=A0A0C2M4T1_THEKT|nr:SCAN domain-containing protein 3 [Thelohanellus kitauei]
MPETSQQEFIELINSDVARIDFSSISISQLWIKCLKSYSVISEPFLRLIHPFPPKYICETWFSRLFFIDSKYSIRLDAEDDVGCDFAQTIPRIPYLVKQQQDQSSQ